MPSPTGLIRGFQQGIWRDRPRHIDPVGMAQLVGTKGRFMGFVSAAPTVVSGYEVGDVVIRNDGDFHYIYVLIQFNANLRIWTSPLPVIPEGNVTNLTTDLASKQNFTVCTSGTRPGSPAIGDSIFETDTGNMLEWYGTTPAWQQPWNLAWGVLAESTVTANQTGITTIVDITNATVSFTAVANRKYRCLLSTWVETDVTTAGTCTISLWKGAAGTNVTQICAQQPMFVVDGIGGSGSVSFWTPVQTGLAAGAQGFHARAAITAGTLTINAAATTPLTIYVEDIGPNGAPS